MQGTARLTRYRCIYDDANCTEEDMKQITYHLCHLYASCTKTISYPAPTYYAHKGVYHARSLIKG